MQRFLPGYRHGPQTDSDKFVNVRENSLPRIQLGQVEHEKIKRNFWPIDCSIKLHVVVYKFIEVRL